MLWKGSETTPRHRVPARLSKRVLSRVPIDVEEEPSDAGRSPLARVAFSSAEDGFGPSAL